MNVEDVQIKLGLINKEINEEIKALLEAQPKTETVKGYFDNMTREEIIESWRISIEEINDKFKKLDLKKLMGVSMGIILPMEGEVAKEFLEISKTASISKESYEKCLELSKDIIKR